LSKSLIGQSEVLVICGTVLMLNGITGWGIAMIAVGLCGAIARFAVDFQLIHEDKELQQQKVENEYEKAITRVLSEVAKS